MDRPYVAKLVSVPRIFKMLAFSTFYLANWDLCASSSLLLATSWLSSLLSKIPSPFFLHILLIFVSPHPLFLAIHYHHVTHSSVP